MRSVRYNLDRLLKPYNFPTYPEDNIKDVKVTLIRLKPYNGECDITIKIPGNGNKTIYEIAARWINFENSEIINVLMIREVELLIEFHDNEKNINFRIKADGYYFIDNLPIEAVRLIEKYLNYWKLIN